MEWGTELNLLDPRALRWSGGGRVVRTFLGLQTATDLATDSFSYCTV